jgi:hypothetical protein
MRKITGVCPSMRSPALRAGSLTQDEHGLFTLSKSRCFSSGRICASPKDPFGEAHEPMAQKGVAVQSSPLPVVGHSVFHRIHYLKESRDASYALSAFDLQQKGDSCGKAPHYQNFSALGPSTLINRF